MHTVPLSIWSGQPSHALTPHVLDVSMPHAAPVTRRRQPCQQLQGSRLQSQPITQLQPPQQWPSSNRQQQPELQSHEQHPGPWARPETFPEPPHSYNTRDAHGKRRAAHERGWRKASASPPPPPQEPAYSNAGRHSSHDRQTVPSSEQSHADDRPQVRLVWREGRPMLLHNTSPQRPSQAIPSQPRNSSGGPQLKACAVSDEGRGQVSQASVIVSAQGDNSPGRDGSDSRRSTSGSTSQSSNNSAYLAVRNNSRSSTYSSRGGSGGSDSLVCEHYSRCSGCTRERGLASPPQLADARAFFKSLGLPGVPMVAGPLHGWRRRAKLAVRGHLGRIDIGLFQSGSHGVLPMPNCATHHPRINEAVALIQKVAEDQRVMPYRESDGTGLLRYLQLTVVSRAVQGGGRGDMPASGPLPAPRDLYGAGAAGSDDPVQVVLVVNAGEREGPVYQRALQLASAIWKHGGPSNLVHSVWLNLNSAASNTVLGRQWVLRHGPCRVYEAWGGMPVAIAPGSFVQANYGAFVSAIGAMRDALPVGAKRMVEMHAGVGAIGLSLAAGPNSGFTSLRCVEINPEGQAPFFASAQAMGLSHSCTSTTPQSGDRNHSSLISPFAAPSTVADATTSLPTSPTSSPPRSPLPASSAPTAPGLCVEYCVEAAGARPSDLLAGADVVVVDPPRKGLEPSLLAALADLSWERPATDATAGTDSCPQAQAALDDSASPQGRPGLAEHAPLPLRRLLYLSCGWAALQRDTAVLLGLQPTPTAAPPAKPRPPAPRLKGRRRAAAAGQRWRQEAVVRDSGGTSVAGEGAVQTEYSWVRVRPARWRLVSSTAFLFFPGTDSIETLAVFEELPLKERIDQQA